MKKSDAVKLIEEVIYDTYDYDPDLGWTVDAEAVLDALLKEGMLPPKIDVIIEGNRGERVYKRSKWEPEDE